MNPIASVGLAALTTLEAPAAAAAAAPAPASVVGAAGRDEQMAELGTTASSVNALQSLAMQQQQQPMAPITLPPTQHITPPQANTSDELVASMSGGNSDD